MIELGGSAIPAHATQDFVLEVRPLALGESVIVRPIEPLDESWAGISLDRMGWRRKQSHDPARERNRIRGQSNNSQVHRKLGVTMKSHDERLQAIFREFPRFKAAVDDGTMRVWIDDRGVEHIALTKRSHVTKGRKSTLIDDDQHEEIKARAKELQDLIEEHPYLQRAIEDHWAEIRIQEDGNLGLEFKQGYPVHLHCL
jgi:hypothetical protein